MQNIDPDLIFHIIHLPEFDIPIVLYFPSSANRFAKH